MWVKVKERLPKESGFYTVAYQETREVVNEVYFNTRPLPDPITGRDCYFMIGYAPISPDWWYEIPPLPESEE